MFGFSLSPYVILGVIIVILGAADAVLFERDKALGVELEAAQGWETADHTDRLTIGKQARQIAQLEADRTIADQVATSTLKADQLRRTALQVQLAQWKEAADAQPQNTCRLGAIVRGALPSLQPRGADPAGD